MTKLVNRGNTDSAKGMPKDDPLRCAYWYNGLQCLMAGEIARVGGRYFCSFHDEFVNKELPTYDEFVEWQKILMDAYPNVETQFHGDTEMIWARLHGGNI
jgi:hypothetical protein